VEDSDGGEDCGLLTLGIVGSQPPRTVRALLDTGARYCHIRTSYAEMLGLPQKTAPPQTFRVANGGTVLSERDVEIPIRLTQDAPVRTYTCWVSSSMPTGNYILLGRDALNGFAITLSTPPRLEWVQTSDVGDRIDPIDPSEPVEPTNAADSTSQQVDAPAAAPTPEVTLGDKLSADEKAEITALLDEYSDVFSPLNREPAKLPPFTVVLREGAEPFHMRPRPTTAEKREFIAAEVDRLLRLGIIQPSTSAWAAPVVVTTKRNGKFRLCVDFKGLNNQTIKDAHPLPRVEDLTHSVAGRPYLASFDMAMGYHQAPVESRCTHLLAFTTHCGLYEYCRLPFGVTNGPPYFQSAISNLFAPLKNVCTYLDDCALATEDFPSFIDGLRAMLDLARRHNLHLNASKSTIGPPTLPYLGRLIGTTSVAIDPERLQPLRDLQHPTTKNLLHSFLGLVQYHARFIPHLATTAACLWSLMKKNAEFKWESQHATAFETLKKSILQAPILAQPLQGAQQILRTDASAYGIGGQLLQRDPGSQELQTLAYYSRRLTATEQRYSTIEKECLAIVYCLDKARPLLVGPVVIQTDHRNLQFLRASINPRVQRWVALLADFDLVVEYRPGSLNYVADCLSRLSCGKPLSAGTQDQQSSPTVLQLEDAGAADPVIAEPDRQSISTLIRNVPHHTDQHGVIILHERPPPEVSVKVWALVHDDLLAGHLGVARTLHRARAAIEWPGMKEEFTERVHSCVRCQKIKSVASKAPELYSTRAQAPFTVAFMDYIGPLRPSDEFKYILVTLDRFSHMVQLEATRDTTAETTATIFFNEWMCSFGIPTRVVTDGGPSFTGQAFTSLLRRYHIEHRVTSPHHPQSHGAEERANRYVEQIIQTLLKDQPDWHKLIKPTAFAMNTAYSRVIGTAPFKVVHGFCPRLPVHAELGGVPKFSLPQEPFEVPPHLVPATQQIFQQVRRVEAKVFDDTRARFLKSNKQRAYYNIGDYVLVHYPRPDKLAEPWRGPFQIAAQDNEVTYTVKDLYSGEEQRVHVNRLHTFYPGTLTNNQLIAEAARQGEYYIEAVHRHRTIRGELWFYVKWLGYEQGDIDDDSARVRYKDCRFFPAIKDYIKKHRLRGR